MDFDRTRIAIRERSMLETLDLTIQAMRAFAQPLLWSFAVFAVPLATLNYFLLSDLLAGNRADYTDEEWMLQLGWYVGELAVLVTLQAPIASVIATTYLGKATFVDKPDWNELLRETRESWLAIGWSLLLVRGALAGTLIAVVGRLMPERLPGWELGAMGALLLWSVLVRANRPFLPEIILLERKPLIRRGKNELSIGHRAAILHSFGASDHVTRWLVSAAVAAILVFSLGQTGLFLQGLFLNQWEIGPFLLRYLLPLAMWMAVMFVTVFRFLSYLDLRIRNEGWEIELRLRAEANRLTHSVGRVRELLSLLLVVTGLALSAGSLYAQEPDAGEALRRSSGNWYDPETGSLRRFELAPPDDLENRNSDWERTDQAQQQSESSSAGYVLQTLAWIVLVAAFVLLVGFMVWAFLRRETNSVATSRQSDTDARETLISRIEQLPLDLAVGMDASLAEQAEAFAAEQNWKMAAMCLYGHTLVQMDRRHVLYLEKGKTNRQYQQELRAALPDEQVRFSFSQLIIAFEDAFFGNYEIDETRYLECRRHASVCENAQLPSAKPGSEPSSSRSVSPAQPAKVSS